MINKNHDYHYLAHILKYIWLPLYPIEQNHSTLGMPTQILGCLGCFPRWSCQNDVANAFCQWIEDLMFLQCSLRSTLLFICLMMHKGQKIGVPIAQYRSIITNAVLSCFYTFWSISCCGPSIRSPNRYSFVYGKG